MKGSFQFEKRIKRRTFIVILLSTSVILSCTNKYPKHPHYTLIGEQVGYYTTTDLQGNLAEQFGLKLKLTSNSDTLPPLYLMTCSWTDQSISSDQNVYLGTSCDVNYMSWTTVKKNEYLELATIVRPHLGNEEYDLTKAKFRVALIAIDTTEMDFGFYLFNPNSLKYLDSLTSQSSRYIWSNEIDLNRLDRNEQLPWGSWEKKLNIH